VVHHHTSVFTGPTESTRSTIIIIKMMTRAAKIHQAKKKAKKRVTKE
jgi:hypothetical protein